METQSTCGKAHLCRVARGAWALPCTATRGRWATPTARSSADVGKSNLHKVHVGPGRWARAAAPGGPHGAPPPDLPSSTHPLWTGRAVRIFCADRHRQALSHLTAPRLPHSAHSLEPCSRSCCPDRLSLPAGTLRHAQNVFLGSRLVLSARGLRRHPVLTPPLPLPCDSNYAGPKALKDEDCLVNDSTSHDEHSTEHEEGG